MDKTFTMNEDFDIEKYFQGCCGIIKSNEQPKKVIVKAYGRGADYLRTLPLHESQRELNTEKDAVYFELLVSPTYDFYQALFAQADQIEVVEPTAVRKQMKHLAKKLMNYYKD